MRLLWALLPFVASAQSRMVCDRTTRAPLPFATIRLGNRAGGTIADEGGRFRLLVQPADTLLITSVGYRPLRLPAPDLGDTLFLLPKPPMYAVTVRAWKPAGLLHLGNDTSGFAKNHRVVWGPSGAQGDAEELGDEWAVRIDLPDSGAAYRIKKVYAHLKDHGCPGPLLLRIYLPDSTGTPGETIWLAKVQPVRKASRKGRYYFNLPADLPIIKSTSFFVGLSWLPHAFKHRCVSVFPATFSFRNNIYSRTMAGSYQWVQAQKGRNPGISWTMFFSADVEALK